MRKLGVLTILFMGVFCAFLLLVPPSAYADSVTVTSIDYGPMSGSGPGAGNVYPYSFTVSGTTGIVPLMCLSYENDIDYNEHWTATAKPIAGNKLFEEAAYIFSEMGTYGATDVQWANWELMDPGDKLLEDTIAGLSKADQATIAKLQADASVWVNANPNSSIYSNYVIYVPNGDGYLPNGKDEGVPQTLIGESAPEPGSFLLFGSGMFGIAALLYGRKRKGLKSA